MSQKINPITNKLGILNLWTYEFQKYGVNFKTYFKFIQLFSSIQIYLKRELTKNNFLVDNIEIIQFSNRTLVRIFVFNLKQQFVKQQALTLFGNITSYWLKCSIKVLFYYRYNRNNSSFLVINYAKYLFNQKDYSPKKIFQLIFKLVKEHSNKKRFIYTVKGPQLIQLKGFKIELTGCFESSRTQMTKTLKYNFGSVPLTRLKGYIDYSNTAFFTRFGTCGFKLWFFYTLI